MAKGVDERIDDVPRWFGQVERKENDRIVSTVYVGECIVVTQWAGRGRGGLIP